MSKRKDKGNAYKKKSEIAQKKPYYLLLLQNRKYLLILLFSIPFILRLIYLLQVSNSPLFNTLVMDESSYDAWAIDIAGGNWFGKEIFYQAPLYPYFLALVYTILGHSTFIVRLIQIIVGSMSCVLLFLIGEKLFNREAGILAGLISALYGVFIFHEGLLLKPALVIFLNNLLILGILKTQNLPTIKKWFYVGLQTGLMILLRGNILVYLPFIILWLFFIFKTDWIKYSLAFLIGAAFIISPVTIRNYMLEKDFVLTTSQGGTNFYIGNNPDATGSYTPLKRDRQMPKYEKEDAFQIAMEESGRKLKPSQVSQFWFRKSFTFIKNSPGTFFRLTIKKLLLFFNRQEVEDAINFYYYRNTYWLLSVAFIGFGLIFALGLIGSAIAYKSWKKHSILYIFGIASVVSVVPFYIFSRYRLPVVPVLILFSGNALYHLIKHIKARNYRFITYFFAAFTMILAFSNITVVGTDTSTMHMNIGIAYAEKGQLDEAIANISEAIKLNPNNSNAYKNRGVAYMRKEDFDKAMADFNKAIELNPQNEAAFYSRGLVHMRTGFIDRAIADCNKTIELNPKHALAYNNRGSFYGRKGLLNKAIADLNQSIELDPSLSAAYRNRSIAYKKLGKLDLAKQDEEKAIALQNN